MSKDRELLADSFQRAVESCFLCRTLRIPQSYSKASEEHFSPVLVFHYMQ